MNYIIVLFIILIVFVICSIFSIDNFTSINSLNTKYNEAFFVKINENKQKETVKPNELTLEDEINNELSTHPLTYTLANTQKNKFNVNNIPGKVENFNNNSKINYTITGKTDGFGAQYQAIMSGIAWSRFKNYNYIHTPFKNMEHGGDIKSLNNFIGIPDTHSKNNIDITEPFSSEVHFSSNPSEYYTNDVIALLRNYYYTTPKPIIEKVDIAIHIRRGDVNIETHENRYTSNSYYNKIIKYLNYKYPTNNIVIFSEGSEKNFSELNGKNLSFRLNKSIEETFHSLVSAKILVTAISSFSYSAAILNPNEIYFIKSPWHNPLKNWKIISDELFDM